MSTSINVSFMKRVTTGPYEHEEMKVEFSVPGPDLLDSMTAERRDFVYRTLGKPTTSTNTAITPNTSLKGEPHGNSQESKQESSKETSSKSGKKSSTKSSKEEVKTSEAAEEMETVESPYKDTAPSEPSKEEVKSEPKAPKAAGKKVDSIAYDRENPDHRSTMTNFLTKLTGGKEWAKDKDRSKKASAELTGQPFMDKAGEILPSFQELCKEKFGVESEAL